MNSMQASRMTPSMDQRMAYSMMSERSFLVQDSFIKAQPQEQIEHMLALDDIISEPVNFLSFCPFEWQSMLLAVGTASDLHIVKVVLTDEIVDSREPLISTTLLCSFNTKSKITSLSWSPETSVNSPIKILVFLSLQSEGAAICLWNSGSATALIKKVAGHGGPVNSVHIEPTLGENFASVGNDNLLNIYNAEGEIRAQRILRTAGKYVRFLENEIMVVELSGTIRFYDVPSVKPLRTAFYKAPLPVRLDCVNGTFACVNARGVLSIYRHSDKPPQDFANAAFCCSMALSAVGPWCAYGCGNNLRVLHIESGRIIHQASLNSIRALCWHPQRPLLLVAHGNSVHLYRIQ